MTGMGLAAVRARCDELAALVASGVVADDEAAVDDSAGTAFAATLGRLLGTVGASGDGVSGAVGSSWDASSSAARSVASSSAASGPSVPAAATGPALVEAARAYLGVPYVWGGESLAEGGLDCSGLVQRSLADLGVTGVPRVARDQASLGTAVPSLADALPGDLLVFDGGSHIGIYAGEGQMIDAPRPGKVVQLRDVYETPTTIRRVLPPSAPAGSSDPAVGTGTGDVEAQRALFAALVAGAAA
jgi:cell wall-associated NlpC family hydrolase